MKGKFAILSAVLAVFATPSAFAVTWTDNAVGSVGPLVIESIYQNEWGDAFVTFTTPVDVRCASGGKGLYLMNQNYVNTPSARKSYKMSIAISAKALGKRVVIDYHTRTNPVLPDPQPPNGNDWDACFVNGIKLVD